MGALFTRRCHLNFGCGGGRRWKDLVATRQCVTVLPWNNSTHSNTLLLIFEAVQAWLVRLAKSRAIAIQDGDRKFIRRHSNFQRSNRRGRRGRILQSAPTSTVATESTPSGCKFNYVMAFFVGCLFIRPADAST